MRLGRFVEVRDENSRRSGLPAKKGKSMKAIKSFTAIVAALAFLASVSFAADQTCCEKAKAAGKECAHKCCKEASKDGKTCEKCNPKKEAK